MSANPVEWRPNKRQEDFLSMPTSVFEGFYGGAAGGGKSEVLLMDPVSKGFTNYADFHGIIFRRTFRQLDESLIPRAKKMYGWSGNEALGAKYNDQKKEFRFPSGATIRFSYLETDDHAHDHQTAEYNYAAFDELTHFTEYQYVYITTRVRSSKKGLPAYVRSASNPGGLGHTWVYHRFVKHAEGGHVLINMKLESGKDTKLMFIPAKLTDNPVLMEEDPDYINRLHLLPPNELRALLYGDWHAYAGQVFTEFRSKHFPDEPSNALHVIKPFQIPTWWPKIIAIDWGWDAMTWVGWGALSPDERLFVYREMTCRKTYIADWAADVARLSQFDGNIKCVVLDKSAWAARGERKQIWEQFRDASGMTPEKSDSDRLSGKLLIHEYLRWTQRPEKYIPPTGYDEMLHQKIVRLYGEKKGKEYREMFQPQPEETNLPKVQIFDTCKAVINVIPSCVHAHDSATGKKKEDVEEFNGDDPYDGFRYLLKTSWPSLNKQAITLIFIAGWRSMSTIRERINSWLSVGRIDDTSGLINDYDELKKRFDGLEVAHRKLLERVMDLELREKYRISPKEAGPPPSMENIRPAYRSRRSLLNEAQEILDAQEIPERREVDAKGNVNAG
jgi:hypothetical protein